jgi:hypothetical protein
MTTLTARLLEHFSQANSGSGVILELLLNGDGLRGLVFSRPELILTLGAVVSHEIFRRSIPVILSEHRRIQQDLNRVKYLHRWQLVWDGIGGCTTDKVLVRSLSHPTEALKLSELH